MSKNNAIGIENEPLGEFLVSTYGCGIAFGARGPSEFINRFANFVFNYGLKRGDKINSLGGNCIYYITTTWESLEAALKEYFRGQVILRQLIKPVSFTIDEDSELSFPVYDDSEINLAADELTNQFLNSKIIQDNFMAGIQQIGYGEFSVTV